MSGARHVSSGRWLFVWLSPPVLVVAWWSDEAELLLHAERHCAFVLLPRHCYMDIYSLFEVRTVATHAPSMRVVTAVVVEKSVLLESW